MDEGRWAQRTDSVGSPRRTHSTQLASTMQRHKQEDIDAGMERVIQPALLPLFQRQQQQRRRLIQHQADLSSGGASSAAFPSPSSSSSSSSLPSLSSSLASTAMPSEDGTVCCFRVVCGLSCACACVLRCDEDSYSHPSYNLLDRSSDLLTTPPVNIITPVAAASTCTSTVISASSARLAVSPSGATPPSVSPDAQSRQHLAAQRRAAVAGRAHWSEESRAALFAEVMRADTIFGDWNGRFQNLVSDIRRAHHLSR
jgi:hypothetical protein